MVAERHDTPAVRGAGSGVPLIPHGFVTRSRLRHVLNSAHEASLVVVRGSGGSGKSGLVASWLRERPASVAQSQRDLWVSLDDGTRSRSSFWRRIVLAFHAVGAVTEDSPLSNVIAGYAELDDVPGLVLAQLEHDRTSTRLILDDFHLVDDANAADIIWLLKQSRWLSVIVTTRRIGAFEAVDVGARLHSVVITEEMLAFTAEETRDLFASATRFSAEHALVVHAATQGHPLATRIAVTLLTQRPGSVNAPVADAADLTRQLADHIAQTLLPSFGNDTQLRIATVVSLPPELPLTLASDLVGLSLDETETLVTGFTDEGLGELRQVGSGLVFRFHPLVSEALQQHAARTISEGELRELRLRSAEYLTLHGNGLEALKLFVAAQELERVWPTVAQHFSELINYQQDELHAVLISVPLELLLRHGTAAISLAVVMSEKERMPSARLRHLVARGIEDIDSREAPSHPGQALLLSLARFAGFRAARRYEDAADEGDKFVDQVQALIPSGLGETRQAIGAGLIQIVITNILLGRWQRATTVAHLLSVDDHEGRSQHRASLLAYIHAFEGQMPEASAQLADVTHSDRQGWRTSIPSTGWHIATALSELEAKNPERALKTISILVTRLSHLEHWPFVVWLHARLRLASGEPEVALDEFNAAVSQNEFRPLSDYARSLLQSMKAELQLATGHGDRARRGLAKFDPAHTSGAAMLTRVKLELDADDIHAAANILDLEYVREHGSAREFAEALLLRAALDARVGHEDDALSSLQRAADLMARHGLTSPAVMVPQTELRALSARRAPELSVLFTKVANPFAHVALVNPLTPREREVLAAVARLSSHEEVANALFVSVNTVKSQLRSAYRKLGVSSATDAVRVATDKSFIRRR